ncbi:MAG TPA: magnesium transporter [Thioalkalivibrio sp.]|nr:magnesium transporter [Thioalkalivibrio sp.]
MATYLSQVLNQPVWDAQGRRLGRCSDVLVGETKEGYPVLRAIQVKERAAESLIPAEKIAWLSPSIILNTSTPPGYVPQGDELWLRDKVLDQQIVDTEGRRLVRVNDLQLARSGPDGRYYLIGANVGTLSLVRRLGIEEPASRVLRALGREASERVIPWGEVASVEADAPIRLRVTRDRVREMPAPDIAEIISDLDRVSGQALLETLDDATVADTMSEIEPDLQRAMLEAMPPDRAADVLEEMDPDDAAALLGSLEPEDRANLIELMEEEETSQVIKLLAYPEDTAGGIMTTEFTTIPSGLRAAEALAHLRQSPEAREDEALYYVHVVDEERRLVGVLGLRNLVLADPDTRVEAIMERQPIVVEPLTPQTEVARLVAKYNLLEVPVVDAEGIVEGVVTVDDAIDAIIPTAWKKRLPRFF